MPNFALSELKKLPFDFETEVKNFVQAKKDHLTTEGVPAPTHHQWVEAAVRRIPGKIERVGLTTVHHPDDFEADYAIIDDTPPPPTLDQKKKELADKANMQAFTLANQILPPLKRRLIDFQFNDANDAFMRGIATDADKALIAEHTARLTKIDAVYRHAAKLESEIHDLTEDQVDVWQGAAFPDVK